MDPERKFSFASLAPVSKAEAERAAEVAAGVAPAPAALPAPEPASATAPEAPGALAQPGAASAVPSERVRFLSGRERERFVPLGEPVEFEGAVVMAIRCHRLNARELDAFYDLPASQRHILPTIDASPALLDILDADDIEEVREVALGFLPRSLRPAAEFGREKSD